MPEVEWDGDEPFIRVNDELRLTPYRDPQDVPSVVEISNQPEVGKWSFMRPHPYKPENAREWFDMNVPNQKEWVIRLKNNDLKEPLPGPPVMLPFIVLRNAAGTYLGDCALTLENGQWVLGYALQPAVWGKGIGTAMVDALLTWAEEALGVRETFATIQTTNLASARLVQKLGFEAFKTEMRKWPAFNGGGEREIVHWRRSR